MHVKRAGDWIALTLNVLESRLVGDVFRRLAELYRTKPEDLSGGAAGAFYSTHGCESAGMTPADAAEWLEHLHGFKAARVDLLKGWLEQLATGDSEGPSLRIRLEDVASFVGAINDCRLAAAAEQSIGEVEMNLRTQSEFETLTGKRQEALLEIHFLAWVIEETLRKMEHDC